MNNQIEQFEKLINDHEDYRNRCINLTPSENILSPLAKKAIQSDMGQRYFFENAYSPKEGASYSYKGSKYIEKLLDMGHEIAKDIFNADYVSLYALSGHQANIALLFAFTKPGDTILCHSPSFGGYPGLDKDKLPKYLSVQVQYFPMMEAIPEMIDVGKTVALIDQIKPKLIIFSSANTLFPMPIKDIKMAAEKIGSKVVYDGSHPLGLITGNRFQNPLNEGADVLVGGTQKSFPGPQGAIMATNNCVDNIKEIEHFVTVDNPHFHRIAALVISMMEMKHYGERYADQTIKNAKYLAQCLSSLGLPVCYRERGFTESHMFKIQIASGYSKFIENLEKANIILDSAGRVGVNEMTRLGMKEGEMEQIAEFINDIKEGRNSSIVRKEVVKFRLQYQDVHFC